MRGVANGAMPPAAGDVVMKDESTEVPSTTLETQPPEQTQAQQDQQVPEPQAAKVEIDPAVPDGTSPAPAAAAATTRNSQPPPTVNTSTIPTKAAEHGSSTRLYLNRNVTPHLLEAMKHLATSEPEKPLLWLSEFLAKRSAEVETGVA